MIQFDEIIKKFQVEGEVSEVKPLGQGKVNHTYEVVCGGVHYVLQEINHIIFKYPVDVMNNLFLVTEYLKNQLSDGESDPHKGTLTFIRTVHDNELLQTESGNYYRLYRMVEHGDEMQKPSSEKEAYEAAAAVGSFQHLLIGFPVHQLSTTFPRMHSMKDVMHALLDAVRGDICSRTSNCQEQIRFVLDRSDELYRIDGALSSGMIPRRVVHNDAGYTNVLYDEKTQHSVCMIDLDTVMPGCSLYDFGETVRTGAASVSDLDKSGDVEISLSMFRAAAEGYLYYMNRHLTAKEKELMVYACWLITMEKGITYLTDYLNGDMFSYDFSDEKQNLYRAVNQFFLVLDMEDKKEQMEQIIKEVLMSAPTGFY